MEQGQQFSHLIYEYFYLRFRFGYYRFGEFLPPVDFFCREFCVAPETVKVALRRLRDEGYIDMGRGRMTRVVFSQSDRELQSFTADFFSRRWNALEDLYRSADLLFAPLLVQGLRRMDTQELNALQELARQSGRDDLFHFYSFIMQKLENPLAMNFFWEASLFQGFPLARWEHRPTQYGTAEVGERMRALLSGARARRWEEVRESLCRFCREDLTRITAYLKERITPLPMEEQIPYVWRIYRDRPQICCNLASQILHEIYICGFRDCYYLPSYAKLAEKYGVSLNTIRRTVGILNRLGAVMTVNGKGTRVFPLGRRCNFPDFADPIIRRNLAFYVQAFQLVCHTCESVMRALPADLTPEAKEKLICQLQENLRCGHSDISLWHILLAIAARSHLQVVRAFYGAAYGLFLWGYPLKASKEGIDFLDREAVEFTETMIRYLKEDNPEGCAAALKNLLTEKLGMSEAYLIRQGIPAEELWPARSIRFLSVEDAAGRPEE